MKNPSDERILNSLETFEKELRTGLRENRFTIDDVEKLMVQHWNEIQQAFRGKVGDILAEESGHQEETCKECGKTLKKTKKEDSR